MSGWQYKYPDGHTAGPVCEHELSKMISDGDLGINTLVCHPYKTDGAWVKAVSVTGPVKQSSTTDTGVYRHRQPQSIDRPKRRDRTTIRKTPLERGPSLAEEFCNLFFRFKVPLTAFGLLIVVVTLLGASMHFLGDLIDEHSFAASQDKDQPASSNFDLHADASTPTNAKKQRRSAVGQPSTESSSNELTARQKAVMKAFGRGNQQQPTVQATTADPSGKLQHAESNAKQNFVDSEASQEPTKGKLLDQIKLSRTSDKSTNESTATDPANNESLVRIHGSVLQDLMVRNEVSTSDLSSATGLSMASIKHLLTSGETLIDTREGLRIANELGVDLDSL